MSKKEDATESLYVNIRKPQEIRRNLLECSKDVLYTLQKVERVKQLRAEKNELAQKLKVQIGEINILTAKLAEHLPDSTATIKQTKDALLEKKKKHTSSKRKKTKKRKHPTRKKRKARKKSSRKKK